MKTSRLRQNARGAMTLTPPKSRQDKIIRSRPPKTSANSPISKPKRDFVSRTNRFLKLFAIAGLTIFLQGVSLPAGVTNKSKITVSQSEVAPSIPALYSMDSLRLSLIAQSKVAKLRTGIFVFDPRGSRYVDVAGHESFAAASMIKLPILVALLAALDRGSVQFSEQLTIRPDLVTGGSGSLQWRPLNSQIRLAEAAELMMVVSDNTATNLIIDRLGGKEKLNAEFISWGLNQTVINNMLGDFEGTNKTSPFDLVYLLARIDRGELVSGKHRDWLLEVMRHTRIRTLLNPGLGAGAKIAHKTGDIGTMVGDVGIVYAPNGSRYIVSIQVERRFNDRRANALIRNLSKSIYNGLIAR